MVLSFRPVTLTMRTIYALGEDLHLTWHIMKSLA